MSTDEIRQRVDNIVDRINDLKRENGKLRNQNDKMSKVVYAANKYMRAYLAASDLTLTGHEESARLHHQKREAWIELRHALEALDDV